MKQQNAAERYMNNPVSAGMNKGNPGLSRLRAWVVGQFSRPTGFWGHMAGWIMASRKSNIQRNLWTVELLDIQSTDRVLEIGSGPGIAIEAISKCLKSGTVLGVDHSGVMVRQATRRNKEAVASGRARVLEGHPTSLPSDIGSFNKMLAVNVVMFWEDPVAGLRTLKEHLSPNGRIALTMQPRSAKATDADAHRAGESMCEQLRAAGYRSVRLEVKPMEPVAAVCALGER